MPEKLIDITVTPAQLVHLHAAMIDYIHKISRCSAELAAFGLMEASDITNDTLRELRSMASALADLMED